jgi:hypothetical protein
MEPSIFKLVTLLVLFASSTSIEIKGINFVSMPYTQAPYSHKNAKLSLEHLKQTGATWISVPVAFFQDETDSSEMKTIDTPMSTRDRVNLTPSN